MWRSSPNRIRNRGGPSDRSREGLPAAGRIVELNHVIRAGMVTYPGLPGPQITPYLTGEASRGHYVAGTEFAIDRLSLLGNTSTYLDAPYHRYRDGADLSGIALARTADLPAVVVRVTGTQQPGIDVGALAALDVTGAAVLLHTGDDATSYSPRAAGVACRGGCWCLSLGAPGGVVPVVGEARRLLPPPLCALGGHPTPAS
jgi:kynurenine formamidase